MMIIIIRRGKGNKSVMVIVLKQLINSINCYIVIDRSCGKPAARAQRAVAAACDVRRVHYAHVCTYVYV